VWSTNISAPSTNATNTSVNYNLFAADLVYGFSIGDLRIHSDPWNRVEYCAYSGTSVVSVSPNAGATEFTTEKNVGGYGFRGPIQLDYSAGAFSISLPIMIMADGQSSWVNGAANSYSDFQIGAVAKINYTFNELFGVWVDVGLVSVSGGSINTNNGNTNTYSGLVVPSTFGIKLTPAPVWTINLGYGYAFTLGYQTQNITGGNATNTTTYGSLPDTMYDAYGCHGYDHPFVNLSVDTKFATDWTAGLRFIVYIDNAGTGPGDGTGQNAPYINNFGGGAGPGIGAGAGGQTSSVSTTAGSVTYTTINNWLFFNNEGDWDNFGGSACYLGYSKDNFSVKLYTAANTTQTGTAAPYNANGGAEGSVGLLGLFGEIDVSIKF